MTYTPILSSLPRSRRICSGVRLKVTLIFRHTVAIASPQFELILPHQGRFILLIIFYHIQGNVIVIVTFTPILDSRPRRRRLYLGVRLYVTLIVSDIVAYA